MRNRLLIKEEIKIALRKLIKEEITKKSDYQSVGLGGVNNPEDVEHILNLFSDPKVGFAADIEKIKKECSTENDFKKIGECKKFQDFIAEYQKTKVFPSGFNDSRIDSGMQTITLLYNTVLGTKEKPKELAPGSEIEIVGETVAPKDWNTLVNLVINNLEGGYYHPAMKPYLKGGENLGDSGETLFGIDRKHGGTINTTSEGVKFWSHVDENSGWAEQFKLYESVRAITPGTAYNLVGTIREIDTKNNILKIIFQISGENTLVNLKPAQVEKLDKPKWKYSHVPKESTLRDYVAGMIKTAYEADKDYANVTAEMEKFINSDARLQLHFIYGVWNGMGNFKSLYDSMVRYIRNANDNKSSFTMNDILKDGINARKRLPGNSIIIQRSAKKVSALINSLS